MIKNIIEGLYMTNNIGNVTVRFATLLELGMDCQEIKFLFSSVTLNQWLRACIDSK